MCEIQTDQEFWVEIPERKKLGGRRRWEDIIKIHIEGREFEVMK